MSDQPFEGHETVVPLAGPPNDSSLRMLRTAAVRLGITPECQPITSDVTTFADHDAPEPEVTGYLLTCATCGSELIVDAPAALTHLDDGHEVRPLEVPRSGAAGA